MYNDYNTNLTRGNKELKNEQKRAKQYIAMLESFFSTPTLLNDYKYCLTFVQEMFLAGDHEFWCE